MTQTSWHRDLPSGHSACLSRHGRFPLRVLQKAVSQAGSCDAFLNAVPEKLVAPPRQARLVLRPVACFPVFPPHLYLLSSSLHGVANVTSKAVSMESAQPTSAFCCPTKAANRLQHPCRISNHTAQVRLPRSRGRQLVLWNPKPPLLSRAHDQQQAHTCIQFGPRRIENAAPGLGPNKRCVFRFLNEDAGCRSRLQPQSKPYTAMVCVHLHPFFH